MRGAVMMKNVLIPLTSGIIFGIGLVIAGMTNPSKVMGFFNVFVKRFYEEAAQIFETPLQF